MKKIFTAFIMMLCAACVASAANYLTFTAEEDGSTFGIVNYEGNNPDVQYTLDDGETWTALAAGDTITLAHKGDKALLRGDNPNGFSKRYDKYSSFTMTGKIAASGSVMSLIDGTGETIVVPADYCFYRLFKGCTSLTQTPELPATTLAGRCYGEMFSCCTSLTQAPELPATTLAYNCYDSMFYGCTSLTQAPELPATTLAEACYWEMFDGCKSLTQAPELPATTLTEDCYAYMFRGCTSLTRAPELPATTLAFRCYDGMFEGCTSLTQAPELPATQLAEVCYWGMFDGCTNISKITVSFDDWMNDGKSTHTWVKNVAPTGTFICPKDLPLEYGDSRIPEGWTVKYIDDTVAVETNYLTFTAEEDGSMFSFVNKDNNPDVQYSLDGGVTWIALEEGDTVILAHKGDKALLRGDNPQGFSKGSYRYSTFRMTGKVAASGSVMSLVDGAGLSTEIPVDYCFYGLFNDCTSLTQAPELPATRLESSCYNRMFSGCTSLTKAPELPATTLASYCYEGMFSGCTSLTQAPELPATTLANGCYREMFKGCTSLTQTPELPATTLAGTCYYEMFLGCTSLAQAPALSATTLAYGCYNTMFSGCTSLTQAPELPATTLASDCYRSMFSRCTSLTQAPELPATTLASGCYQNMFSGCIGLTKTPKLPVTTLKYACYESMFSGCTNLTEAPELPAATLAAFCYKDMFSGCKSLTQAPELSATTLTESCYSGMFSHCTGLTQAPELPAKALAPSCYCVMFSGCTSLTQVPELPATTLNSDCYRYMFSGCTSLTQAPELPAMTLASDCYYGMLSGCTSLTQAPELPATTLTLCCYEKMFSGCTRLTQAPELPATTLKDYCYADMFSDCTSLTEVPELPATALIANCYNSMFKNCTGLTRAYLLFEMNVNLIERSSCLSEMFSGCTNLSEISVVFDEWSGYTQNWVENVAPTGTFYCPKALSLEYGLDRIPEGWTVKYIDDTVAAETNYLTFTAEEDGSSFRIVNKDKKPDVQYSLDGGKTWTALAVGDTVILAHKGDKALLRGNNPNGLLYSTFEMAGKVAASGSVMSLIDGTGLSTEIPWDYCFSGLFYYCTSLTQAPELPATTLADFCYFEMFSGCKSLTQAPELPATTLADFCYFEMFSGCKSLTQAPELPATTLVDNCYQDMFYNCTNLSEINVSFVNWSDAKYCTARWTQNVAPTGTFICPKDLPLEYGDSRIPEGWTVKYIDDTVAVETNYLTFSAEEDGSSFGIVNNGSNNPDVQYSLDGGKTWTALAEGDSVVLAHKGDKALLKGNNPEGFSKGYSSSFTLTGKVAASGSVMSLVDGLGVTTAIPNEGCFYCLFFDCSALTQAPELPATTLAERCYEGMFSGCTSLTQAPALPATILAEVCYREMFRGCTSLTQAPELPATTLAESCYIGMFLGCTSLSEIKVSFDDWNRGHYTGEWVIDVAPTGTFICPKALALEYGWESIPEGWTVKYIDDTVAVETNYLTFTAEEDGSTFGIVNNGGNNPDIQYSLDGGETWTALAAGDTITLAHKGDKALLRGNNPEGFSKGNSKYSSFTMTGKIAASGSVMSLIDGIGKTLVVPAGYCFYALFKGCTSLTQAPELPATTLVEGCYSYMFNGCTSLTQAHELPATTLAASCCSHMFSDCTSLTQAPELPATTLAEYCYYEMFLGCTSLTQAPELPATTLVDDCYWEMFSGCTSLTQAPELPATKLARGCYESMFSGCTSLTQTPELPATTLAYACYASMFDGCVSLTEAPELPATTLAGACYRSMFYGCTSLTRAPELPAPELIAPSNTKTACYSEMFLGCNNLSEISVAFVEWGNCTYPSDENTYRWVADVAPTGTFICPKALPLEYGVDRIPEGWTVKYIEGEGSGVNTTLANDITIWTDNLTIYARGVKGEVSLYDVSGKRVAVSVSADGECALCVPARGVYVVRTSGGEKSVLVR